MRWSFLCVLLLHAVAVAVAGPEPELKIEAIIPDFSEGGTMRYSNELKLSVGDSEPLILKSDIENSELVPTPGFQLPIGANHVLLFGKSSWGGGMVNFHALLFKIEKGRISQKSQFQLTLDRTHASLLVRRIDPDQIRIGIFEPISPFHDDLEWRLALGSGKRRRLGIEQIQNLPYATETIQSTDIVYASAFRDEKRMTKRVAWISANENGFKILKRKSHSSKPRPARKAN